MKKSDLFLAGLRGSKKRKLTHVFSDTESSNSESSDGEVDDELETDVTHKVNGEQMGHNSHPETPAKSGTHYEFFAAKEIIEILNNPKDVLPDGIPFGPKENVYFVIEDRENVQRRSEGKKSVYWDDCGAWSHGSSPRSYFVRTSGNKLKSVKLKGGKYISEKQTDNKRIHEELNPQPTEVVVIHRYYCELQRDKGYRRRISWIKGTENMSAALVEYMGKYPVETSCHGNAKKNQDDNYKRTNPKTLEKISRLVKFQTPRDVYKALTTEDSFNGPRDFKQCQNKAHNDKKKEKGSVTGKRNNFADEIIASMELCDDHPMVQEIIKLKKELPHFIFHR